MRVRPAVWSRLHLRLSYSSTRAQKVGLNTIGRRVFPYSPAKAIRGLLVSVAPALVEPEEPALLLTIDWESRVCFLWPQGGCAARTNVDEDEMGLTVWCLHCDLWNVPLKRILRLHDFPYGHEALICVFILQFSLHKLITLAENAYLETGCAT